MLTMTNRRRFLRRSIPPILIRGISIAIMLLIPLFCVELLSYTFMRLRPNYFSNQEKSIDDLRARLDRYPEFLERAYVPSAGWDTVAGERREEKACNGRRVT